MRCPYCHSDNTLVFLERKMPAVLSAYSGDFPVKVSELDEYCEATVLGEPQLGRRGLYPNLSTRESGAQVKDMMNLLAYSDGHLSLFEIAEIIEVPFWRVEPLARKLMDAGVLRRRSRL